MPYLKEKLFIAISHYKPGYKAGGPIQSTANLTNLLKDFFNIYIYTKDHDFGEPAEKFDIVLGKWITSVHNEGVQVKYNSSLVYNLFPIFSLLSLKPSLIYINSLFEPSSLLIYLQALLYSIFYSKTKIIIAPRGELDPGALHLKATKKRIFLFLFKPFAERLVHFHATTEIEKNNIKNIFPNAKISVAQNIPMMGQEHIRKEKTKNNSEFVFFSRISPKKNLVYVLDVLQKLSIKGTLRFTIIGPKEDADYWDLCLKKIEALGSSINVTYLGSLQPEVLREKLKDFHYFFFPTLGENFGHVIYEALLHSLPIIVSDQTPWRSKQLNDGVFDLPLKNIDNFIAVIEKLHSSDNLEYQKLSKAAHDFAINSYDRNKAINEYKLLFAHVKK